MVYALGPIQPHFAGAVQTPSTPLGHYRYKDRLPVLNSPFLASFGAVFDSPCTREVRTKTLPRNRRACLGVHEVLESQNQENISTLRFYNAESNRYPLVFSPRPCAMDLTEYCCRGSGLPFGLFNDLYRKDFCFTEFDQDKY